MPEQKTNIRVVSDAADVPDAKQKTAPGTAQEAAPAKEGAPKKQAGKAKPAQAEAEKAAAKAKAPEEEAPQKAKAPKKAEPEANPAGAGEGKGKPQPQPQPQSQKPGKGPGKGPGAQPGSPVRPVASPARIKSRHWGILFSLLLLVVVPVVAATWYVYERAVDQYASTVGFTVRSEDVSSAVDILGGLGTALGGGGGGSSDSDILYEFIRSQELVALVDARLDLRDLYSRHFEADPIFGFDPSGSIEDLTDYWSRMVRISYDANSGLMELRVLAFAPEEARMVAEAIFEEGTRMINDLSAIAREDATRYAREDLDLSVERLKAAREALTAFRIENEIVDVTADIQGQMGLLNTLQSQLAAALIEYDLLLATARAGDPRLEQAERRIEVIENRIDEERQKFGVSGSGPGGESYATTVAEYERLTVDREFAEQAYVASQSAYDGARAEANRQSRYLAAYIDPTLAEKAEFPQRALIVMLVAAFAFLSWAILTLVYYSLRDRP